MARSASAKRIPANAAAKKVDDMHRHAEKSSGVKDNTRSTANQHHSQEQQKFSSTSASSYLYSIYQVPPWLRYNQWIHGGYRGGSVPTTTTKQATGAGPGEEEEEEDVTEAEVVVGPLSINQALLSLFYIHNETLNVWGHLLGAVVCSVFLLRPLFNNVLLLLLGDEVFRGEGGDVVGDDSTARNSLSLLAVAGGLPGQDDMPGISVMFSFAFVFTFSCVYHLFMPCCRTQKSYADLLCVDVLGSLVAMVCSSFSFLLYGNRCFPLAVGRWTTGIILVYGLLLVYVIRFNTTMTPLKRVLMFATMIIIRGLFGAWTVSFKVSKLGLWTGTKYHILSFSVLLVGAIFNVSRFPERLLSPPAAVSHHTMLTPPTSAAKNKKKKTKLLSPYYWLTDYAFNSHNIWHFFCLLTILYSALGCHYDRVEYEVQGRGAVCDT